VGVDRKNSREAAPFKNQTPLKRQVGKLGDPKNKAKRDK
jgi:hypothetical protein